MFSEKIYNIRHRTYKSYYQNQVRGQLHVKIPPPPLSYIDFKVIPKFHNLYATISIVQVYVYVFGKICKSSCKYQKTY